MDKALTVDDYHEVIRISVAPYWMRPFCCGRKPYHINDERPSRLSVWIWGALSMYMRPLPIGLSSYLMLIIAIALARIGTNFSMFFAVGLPLLTVTSGFDAWCQQRMLEKLVDNPHLAEQLLQEGCILSKWFSLNEIQVHPQAPMEIIPPATSLEAPDSDDRFQVAPFIRGVSNWPRLDPRHPLLWQVGAVLVRIDEAVQSADAKEPPAFGKNYRSKRLTLDVSAFVAFLLVVHYAKASLMQLFFGISIDFILYAAIRITLQSQRLKLLQPVMEQALADMEAEILERTICWRVRLQEGRIFGDVPALEWIRLPVATC